MNLTNDVVFTEDGGVIRGAEIGMTLRCVGAVPVKQETLCFS